MAIGNSAQPGAESDQGPIDRGSGPISPNRDLTGSAMPALQSSSDSTGVNSAANRVNGTENGVGNGLLPESNNQEEKSGGSKKSTASGEKEKVSILPDSCS